MEKKQILAICNTPSILATILRLINNNPAWNSTGADSLEDALKLFGRHHYDLVLLGSGLSEQQEEELLNNFKAVNSNTPVVKHYGGGSGLLTSEIRQAIG